jgi:hypothetical protein
MGQRRAALWRTSLWRAALAVCVLALFSAAAFAQQPPGPDCRRVSKIEYDSAKSHYLLHTKFGVYLRNGPFWRRRHWYCR